MKKLEKAFEEFLVIELSNWSNVLNSNMFKVIYQRNMIFLKHLHDMLCLSYMFVSSYTVAKVRNNYASLHAIDQISETAVWYCKQSVLKCMNKWTKTSIQAAEAIKVHLRYLCITKKLLGPKKLQYVMWVHERPCVQIKVYSQLSKLERLFKAVQTLLTL